jgi:hypothetical protein
MSRSAEGSRRDGNHNSTVIDTGRRSAGLRAHCAACGRVSGPYWWRWRVYRIDFPEAGDNPEVAVYCQSCADRRFGLPRRRPLADPPPAPRS